MDKIINLSYLITTRNRLPYLKITLQKLIAQLQPDEEIIVVDAQSTDGTQVYLEDLCNQRKIHQYLSEPDRNQAHGWNKAMLMAQGTIIKKIIDDDVFCYEAIRKCKNYLLQNPQIDVVISNDLSASLNNYTNIAQHSRFAQFENWRSGKVPSFTFSDVHMLIRRSSLAYLGLYDTRFTMMDWEYALRLSYKQANIAYYTGYNALTVAHPQTVTSTVSRGQLVAEGKLGAMLYDYAGDDSEISAWSKFKIMVGKALYKQAATTKVKKLSEDEIAAVYAELYKALQNTNQQAGFKFISNQ